VNAERRATVWSSTWVPAKSPIEGFGVDGYAVAWVDTDDATRIQILIDGPAPAPGTPGRLAERSFGDLVIALFERSGS
jgi:hypothetical protein